MMASELARRGVPVRIVDASPAIDPHVRANLVHSRTLEIFQSLGLVARVTEGSVSETAVRMFARGAPVGRRLHAPIDSPFPYGMSQSQAHVEAVLEDHLNALGGRVERGVELNGLESHADRVVATLAHPGGRAEIVDVPWLIGCDGAHSTVRHLIGCAFPGDRDPHPYVLADVLVEGDLERTESYLFFHDEGELFLFATLPSGHRLICANLESGEVPPERPTLEQMQDIVTRRSMQNLRISEPLWLASFRIHYRLAPHYRHERTFLAGDAAHVHSPIGGQGMNTGIQDAYNLGWKLAAVIHERAPAWWLETYEDERRAVGEDVVSTTRHATEQTELFAALAPAERERLLQHMFAPEHERLKAAQHLQEVDLDYRTSRLSAEAEGEFGAGPHVGAEAPHAMPLFVAGVETPFFELLCAPEFTVLLFAGSGVDVDTELAAIADCVGRRLPRARLLAIVDGDPSGARVPVGATIVHDRDGALHRRYGADGPCAYVLRPDGYVAWRGRTGAGAERALERLLTDVS